MIEPLNMYQYESLIHFYDNQHGYKNVKSITHSLSNTAFISLYSRNWNGESDSMSKRNSNIGPIKTT